MLLCQVGYENKGNNIIVQMKMMNFLKEGRGTALRLRSGTGTGDECDGLIWGCGDLRMWWFENERMWKFDNVVDPVDSIVFYCVYCGFLILFEGFMARVGACPASLREDARWLEQVKKKT